MERFRRARQTTSSATRDQIFARFSWGKDDNVEAPFLITLPSGFGTGTTFNHPNGASIGWTHDF